MGPIAADCDLLDDTVYHYWFDITDSSPYGDRFTVPIACTDPTDGTLEMDGAAKLFEAVNESAF